MHAVKSKTVVREHGRIEIYDLPLPEGTDVEVIILAHDDATLLSELTAAAESSVAFWNNAIDDRVWNDA